MNLFSCTSSNAAAKPSPNNQLRLKNLRWARFWYDWCSSQDGFHYHDQSWKKVCYLTSLTNKWSSLRNEADAASTSNYMVRDWVTELPWTVWNDVEWDGVLYIAACETYAMFVEFLEGPPVPIWYVGEPSVQVRWVSFGRRCFESLRKFVECSFCRFCRCCRFRYSGLQNYSGEGDFDWLEESCRNFSVSNDDFRRLNDPKETHSLYRCRNNDPFQSHPLPHLFQFKKRHVCCSLVKSPGQ